MKFDEFWKRKDLPFIGNAFGVDGLDDYQAGIIEELCEFYHQAQLKLLGIANVNGGILEDFPENMPLYKDSGLWQLRSDDMEDVILDQGVNESDVDFINRCIAYYR